MSYEECIKNYKLFWQYPVITEKTFYEQNKHIDNYVAFPWASIKDSGYDLQVIYKIYTFRFNSHLNQVIPEV